MITSASGTSDRVPNRNLLMAQGRWGRALLILYEEFSSASESDAFRGLKRRGCNQPETLAVSKRMWYMFHATRRAKM